MFFPRLKYREMYHSTPCFQMLPGFPFFRNCRSEQIAFRQAER